MPDVFKDDTPLNYKIMENMGDFEVCKHEQKPKPTADEIATNKTQVGLGRVSPPARLAGCSGGSG